MVTGQKCKIIIQSISSLVTLVFYLYVFIKFTSFFMCESCCCIVHERLFLDTICNINGNIMLLTSNLDLLFKYDNSSVFEAIIWKADSVFLMVSINIVSKFLSRIIITNELKISCLKSILLFILHLIFLSL